MLMVLVPYHLVSRALTATLSSGSERGFILIWEEVKQGFLQGWKLEARSIISIPSIHTQFSESRTH